MVTIAIFGSVFSSSIASCFPSYFLDPPSPVLIVGTEWVLVVVLRQEECV